MVTEITGNDLTVQKLWYSLKYDRGMVMEVEGDAEVRMFLKGNDKHRYLCVGDSDEPKKRAQKQLHHMKGECEATVMASFVGEAGGIGMILSKRVVREQV